MKNWGLRALSVLLVLATTSMAMAGVLWTAGRVSTVQAGDDTVPVCSDGEGTEPLGEDGPVVTGGSCEECDRELEKCAAQAKERYEKLLKECDGEGRPPEQVAECYKKAAEAYKAMLEACKLAHEICLLTCKKNR